MRSKLALYFSAVTVLYLFCITFIPIPKDNLRVVDTILGFLMGTVVATIMNYYFGDSQTSKPTE